MTHADSRTGLVAYGVLALPLAMLALPVYVHIPKFYRDSFGLELGVLGALMLGTRCLDAVLDPWLGRMGDDALARGKGRLWWIGLGTPFLMVGLLGLFNPPSSLSSPLALIWLGVCSLVVYVALSTVQINYQAHGAEIAHTPEARTRITAWREAFALAGVLLGASLPAVLMRSMDEASAFSHMSLVVICLLVVTAIVTRVGAPHPVAVRDSSHAGTPQARERLSAPLANRRFKRLACVFLCNGTAAAIPSTLVLFYIQDVIGRADLTAQFLLAYFAAGALGMPVWPWLARRLGKIRAWQLSMAGALLVFFWAGTLGPGDVTAFLIVCGLSGLALGGDLALPPALLADLLQDGPEAPGSEAGASYFGWWNLLSKMSLGLAAGLALPLAQWLGYVPGSSSPSGEGVQGLLICYAFLPCGVKLGAILLLQGLSMAERPGD